MDEDCQANGPGGCRTTPSFQRPESNRSSKFGSIRECFLGQVFGDLTLQAGQASFSSISILVAILRATVLHPLCSMEESADGPVSTLSVRVSSLTTISANSERYNPTHYGKGSGGDSILARIVDGSLPPAPLGLLVAVSLRRYPGLLGAPISCCTNL